MNPIYCARAPVRVDCTGGGTDCPPYSVDHGGAVVNFGLARYAFASVQLNDSSEVVVKSEDFGCEVRAASAAELPLDGTLDLLVAIVRRLSPEFGLTLTVHSEVPPGSGLGSSGAVGVACVAALDAAMGITREPTETARLANDIERSDLGYTGGDQDSFGPALGGFNLLQYHQGGGMTPERLERSPDTVRDIERLGLLVYTGEPHLSGSIHQDIKVSYAMPDSPTVAAMDGLKAVGLAGAEALRDGNVPRFAACLSENWVHHRALHPSCDSDELQKHYAASEGLVLGGKTCGAGGGGCIFFIAKPGCRAELERQCTALGGRVFPVRVDMEGVVVWKASYAGD